MNTLSKLPTLALMTTSTVLVGCGDGGIGGSLASPWTYEKTIDPVTKTAIHRSSAEFPLEGSTTGTGNTEITFECKNEGDPLSLTIQVTTFDGLEKTAESGLDLSGDISLRFNDAAIGPIEREGTDFSNSTKWQLSILNYVPLFDAFKNRKEFAYSQAFAGVFQAFGAGDMTQNSVYKIQQMATAVLLANQSKSSEFSQVIGPYQHRIWSDEFVFAASTSAGDVSVTLSMTDANVKKTVEACGFSYGEAPPASQAPDVSQAAREASEGYLHGDDEASAAAAPAEAAAAPDEAVVAPDEVTDVGAQEYADAEPAPSESV
jgi:hypothetical protein